MKLIDQANVSGKKVLVRVDYNVPLDKSTQEVTDDRRIRESIPTLKYILENGGSAVLMSHLGRPKGEAKPEMSLRHTISTIQKYIDQEIIFFR